MNSWVGVIQQELRRFADLEAAEFSPLYAHLAAGAAADPEVAGLLTAADRQEAKPTLLLAAAHRLLQAEPVHELSRYYPSLGGTDGVDAGTWPLFRDFLLARADRARELIANRFTQTNEVARAAMLYPALSRVAAATSGKLALLEPGCSAGLLLGLDSFAYRYQCEGGEQLSAGPAKAKLGLHCALESAGGAGLPKLAGKLSVGARIGLDRAPVDVRDEDELAWLEACVWADQPERIHRLRMAATLQAKNPPELVCGDIVDDLAETADRLPEESPLVVMTSHVLDYLTVERRTEFLARLRELAARRDLWWVSDGSYEATLAHVLPERDALRDDDGSGLATLGVTRWVEDEPAAVLLARTAPHGQRMRWLQA